MTDYALCGWRVRSALALPDGLPWSGDDRAPDITVALGSVPALAGRVRIGGGVSVGRDGECQVDIPDFACFHIFRGREIIVELRGNPHPLELQAWLFGPGLGVLCHQRGLFPLHASCVRIGDGAVALTGRPGAGKSTLAAALMRRGHGLVADDVCVIDPAAAGGPTVLPSFPRLKLWEDAMLRLGFAAEGVPRPRPQRPKFHFCAAESFVASPVKLRAIYVLGRSLVSGQQTIEAAGGPEAADALAREIFRPAIGFRLGHKVALLSAALRIASAVPIWHMPPRPALSQLDAGAARVEAHFAPTLREPDVVAAR